MTERESEGSRLDEEQVGPASWSDALRAVHTAAVEAVDAMDTAVVKLLRRHDGAESAEVQAQWGYTVGLVRADLEGINPMLAVPLRGVTLPNLAKQATATANNPFKNAQEVLNFVTNLRLNLLQHVGLFTGWIAPPREAQAGEAPVHLLASVSTQATTLARQVATAEEAASTIARRLDAERGRVDSLMIKLQESAQKRLDEQATTFRKAAEALVEQEREAFEARAARAEADLAALEGQRAKADELMGIIAGSTVASGYSQVALEARRAARIWEGLGVVALIGFIAVGVWLGSTVIADGATVPMIIARLLAAGGPLFVALYFFRRANTMRSWQRINRQSALGLAALEPYLKDFAPEARDEIRKRLVDRFFQLTPDGPNELGAGVDTKAFKEVMEPVTELVKATRGSK